jgi:hypothetical protein
MQSIIKPDCTYFVQILRDWFLAQDIQPALDCCRGLNSVDIGARGDPNSLEVGHFDHLIVGVEDLGWAAFEELSCPFEFFRVDGAYGDEVRLGNAVDERFGVTLTHTPKADDGDIQFAIWSFGRHVAE